MIKTASDMTANLYKILKNSALFTDAAKPNGGLYKLKRPLGSTSEDVIVSPLGIVNEAVQEGVAIINVFVPNRVDQIEIDGQIVDRSMPNTARLTYLSRLIINIVTDVWVNDEYNFEYQQDIPLPNDENTNEWFDHIRLNFYTQTLN